MNHPISVRTIDVSRRGSINLFIGSFNNSADIERWRDTTFCFPGRNDVETTE
jgi:hypothetical protein